jgi:hypothetical protein
MKWLLCVRASGRPSAFGVRVKLALLSTVNGQRPDTFPETGISLRTGKFPAEVNALEATKHETFFSMMISCTRLNKKSTVEFALPAAHRNQRKWL